MEKKGGNESLRRKKITSLVRGHYLPCDDAGRLPSAVDGNGLAFGSEVRLSEEYKVLCKVGIDNLKMAIDKGTNRALDAYFDGLMQQMQDTGQPFMQSRIAVWYHSTRTAFPEVESRIKYVETYLNKH